MASWRSTLNTTTPLWRQINLLTILRGMTLPWSSCRSPVSIGWLIRVLTENTSPLAAALGTCTRGVGANIPHLLPSLASVGGNLDPGFGHQQCTVVHLRHRQDVLWFGEANTRRYAGLAALWDEVERGDLYKRVSWRQYRNVPDVIGLGHGT